MTEMTKEERDALIQVVSYLRSDEEEDFTANPTEDHIYLSILQLYIYICRTAVE
jgi:hypothetical protein